MGQRERNRERGGERESERDDDAYKLLHSGKSHMRNGVAVVVKERFRDKISLVKQARYDLMIIKIPVTF